MAIISRTCKVCGVTFDVDDRYIKYESKIGRSKNARSFCSQYCHNKYMATSPVVDCLNCKKQFRKQLNQIKNTKNNFCCQSCAAIYNNKHKTTGTRRSKLECFVDEKIREQYPNLNLSTNSIQETGCELDFYFPELKIAIEVNGIFHYKPIYGAEKLQRIKKNDRLKKKECKQNNIKLYVLKDNCQSFSLEYATKFIKRVIKIIDFHLVAREGLEPSIP